MPTLQFRGSPVFYRSLVQDKKLPRNFQQGGPLYSITTSQFQKNRFARCSSCAHLLHIRLNSESLVSCRLWGCTESDTIETTQQQQQQSSKTGSGVKLCRSKTMQYKFMHIFACIGYGSTLLDVGLSLSLYSVHILDGN